MKNKKSDRKNASGLPAAVSLLAIGLVVGMLIITNSSPVPEEFVEQIEQREWQTINLPMLGENDPGGIASGVMGVYIYAHSGKPGVAAGGGAGDTAGTFTHNLSVDETGNASCFAYCDANNTHAGSQVPYGSGFDIVVKVRWNKTHAYEDTNDTWMIRYTSATITCAELDAGLADNATMFKVNITGCTGDEFIWVNYYVNNTNEGYNLTRGQNISHCRFWFDAYV